MAAKPTFEKAIQQLEDIARELEAGDIPLEKALKRFEEGMKLSRLCSRQLDEAERKITLLVEDENGGLAEQDFEV